MARVESNPRRKPKTTAKTKPYERKTKQQTLTTGDLLIENALFGLAFSSAAQ
jgi:hypothetical protein